ncbi:MAG TPA: FAD-binding oxidoreductase [Acidimicrobiia bacterium]
MSYDVLIVGGGVMGSATAYHLMSADPSLTVGVIEKDASYQRASTVLSDGNVRVQFNLEENVRISQYTLEVLETFADDMATPTYRPEVGARHQGNLFMVDESGREEARVGLELQRGLSCEVEWLDMGAVAAAYPAFGSELLIGGTLGRRDGSVDPSAVLRGFRNKAIELGAVYIDDEAASLEVADNRATGAQLRSGELARSEVVVNAAGAWAPALLTGIGVEIPVIPVMRTVYVVSTTVSTAGLPSVFLPSGLYAIPEGEATWLMGWSQPTDPVGFEFRPASHDRFMDLMWPELVSFFPAFDSLRVERSWAGIYDVNTLDGNAIIGEWPMIRGLYVVSGFSGHGFQQAPAVGRFLSESILQQRHQLDLSRLGPQRILDGEPLFEHAGRLI